METGMEFPKNFVWGSATSSYQIEGRGVGKGDDIWDVFCRQPGKIYEGHTGEVACNHYNRYKEDVALMKALGMKAYRFSVNWARVLPAGCGAVNPDGIAFYHALIDELLAAGIEPYMTLYHWELPQALYAKGGLMNPEFVNWFAEYAALLAKEYSGKVTKFFTFNEPQCFVGLGYLSGGHAPGVRLPYADTFQMAHNVLKAHGAAVRALREHARQDIQIGYAPTGPVAYPETEDAPTIEAARKAYFACPDYMDNWTWNIAWWSDPVILGEYPEDGLRLYREYLPEITKEDLKLICQPIDFLGQNVYNGHAVRKTERGAESVKRYEGFPKTGTNWPVTPECIYWSPRFLYERYHLPIYITENGVSCHDVISLDGKVHDPNRIDFLHRYLLQVRRAIADGVDIRGYFEWSLMDNFEWSEGYGQRFGLVYVDYRNQKRIPKDSADWYKRVIETNGAAL